MTLGYLPGRGLARMAATNALCSMNETRDPVSTNGGNAQKQKSPRNFRRLPFKNKFTINRSEQELLYAPKPGRNRRR